MTRSRGPVRDAICRILSTARTREPYPVWMTWKGLAERVYRTKYATSREITNTRRAVDKMYDVEALSYPNGKPAGPRLCGKPTERWLCGQVSKVFSNAMLAVDHHGYRPPSAAEIRIAFENGFSNARVHVDLGEVARLVNETCGTKFDPSEVRWHRQGFEAEQAARHRNQLLRLHGALSHRLAAVHLEEVERRLMAFGPYRVDPATDLDVCPCCRQAVDPLRLMNLRMRESLERAVVKRRGLSQAAGVTRVIPHQLAARDQLLGSMPPGPRA